MRYFIKLSYSGSDFCGWQFQPNAVTVQECLERTLLTLLKEPVQVVGAGRTDSKVNAIGYVAHFDYDRVIDTPSFGYKLNAILPRGIVVHSVRAVAATGDEDLHARFSATRREYTYFLHRTKDPFIEARSYYCPWDLDVDAMNEAATLLTGTHDFRCFEKAGSDNQTSICTVTEAFWKPYTPDHVAIMGFEPAASKPGVQQAGQTPGLPAQASCHVTGLPVQASCQTTDLRAMASRQTTQLFNQTEGQAAGLAPAAPLYLYFRIAADRFLRNMVRAIVGSLIEVGRGRRTVADFATLILPPDFASYPDPPACPPSDDNASPDQFAPARFPTDYHASPGPDNPARSTVGCDASHGPDASARSTAACNASHDQVAMVYPERRRTAADGTPFRSLAGESVPGHALFLSRVDY